MTNKPLKIFNGTKSDFNHAILNYQKPDATTASPCCHPQLLYEQSKLTATFGIYGEFCGSFTGNLSFTLKPAYFSLQFL